MRARDSACLEASGTPGSRDSPSSGAHGTEVKDSEAVLFCFLAGGVVRKGKGRPQVSKMSEQR